MNEEKLFIKVSFDIPINKRFLGLYNRIMKDAEMGKFRVVFGKDYLAWADELGNKVRMGMFTIKYTPEQRKEALKLLMDYMRQLSKAGFKLEAREVLYDSHTDSISDIYFRIKRFEKENIRELAVITTDGKGDVFLNKVSFLGVKKENKLIDRLITEAVEEFVSIQNWSNEFKKYATKRLKEYLREKEGYITAEIEEEGRGTHEETIPVILNEDIPIVLEQLLHDGAREIMKEWSLERGKLAGKQVQKDVGIEL